MVANPKAGMLRILKIGVRRVALWTILVIGIGAIWLLGAWRVVFLVWPGSISEVVTVTPENSRWDLVEGRPEDTGPAQLVTRPRNVTVAETADGERLTGYVVGIRSPESWLEVPELLRFSHMDPAELDPEWVLVMNLPRGARRDLPAETLVRVYRPNRLAPGDAAGVALDRLAARLRDRREDLSGQP